MDRKQFIQLGGFAAISATIPGFLTSCSSKAAGGNELFFDISLAQWSLHRSFFDGKIDPLNFPTIAKEEFEINALEYVNQFYADKAEDQEFLRELKSRQKDAGVEGVLIMCDGEGNLGDTNQDKRKQAVENHYKWIEAADFLGCHSIRVNAAGQGTKKEVAEAAIDGLSSLSEFASDYDLSVIVENHGGYSSNGEWLSSVIKQVNRENCGTLPDFGNFRIDQETEYDKYKGVKELMPFAKGVSAKSHVFNEAGEEANIDYQRMLKIVKDAGFTGYIGIEYEGSELDEYEGIRATKALLEKTGQNINQV